jgi:hypothetical protein
MTVPPQASSSKLDESKYVDIDRVLDRKGPWTEDHFVGGQQVCPSFQKRVVADGRRKMH